MLAAGLLAQAARRARPDAQAVGQDLARARLAGRHRVPRPRRADRAARGARLQPRRLRLHDLHRQLGPAAGGGLARRSASATWRSSPVLSGNRNFEGRIHPDVKMNYLASPPLVRRLRARRHDGHRPRRRAARRGRATASPSTCATSGPRAQEIADDRRGGACSRTCSAAATPRSSTATSAGTALEVPGGDRFAWERDSTYVRQPPFFDGHAREPPPVARRRGRARARACSATSVTTDHISPGRLDQARRARPARYLQRARRRAARTSTPTARAAATTR